MAPVVSVPSPQLQSDVTPRVTEQVEVVLWDGRGEPPRERIDMVVPGYMGQDRLLRRLGEVGCHLVQSQSIGFDGVAEMLPADIVYANAASVHETATAELAVGLLIAAQRRLVELVDAQREGEWHGLDAPGLADKRIVLLGYGGVGKAIARRLDGFESDLVPVASRARTEDGVTIHAIDDLAELLPQADILVNALPGGAQTAGLIDDARLASLPDGALLVNVGRGTTVDTDALVDHVRRGRIRVASDVWDPEPLPAGHPLWSLDGVLITPHVGGRSGSMRPRIAKLVAEQADRLARGEEPLNVVLRS
ncbi:MAG: 2-hydroxyacid dehydrogenase [Microbacterium sp.]